MKTKTFDCVEMKRRGAQALRRRLDGLKPEEELSFWRQAHAEFLRMKARPSA